MMMQILMGLAYAGVVNSVQGSIQSLFGSAMFVVSLVVWQPGRFVWLMLVSCFAVFAAMITFLLWACYSQTHAKQLDAQHMGTAA